MREIEFRGIDEYGNFVFGGFAKNAMTTYGWLAEFAIISNGCYAIDVEPETIGQFTGLKDRNGVDIYEGDIVTWESFNPCSNKDNITGKVIFIECAYWIDNGKNAIPLFQEVGELKVIGNIHQHPELLGE